MPSPQQVIDIDGLRTTIVGSQDNCTILVVLLHGFAMTAADLAPFARSLGVNALFLFPEGPFPAIPRGQAWFLMAEHTTHVITPEHPRDLADYSPNGLRRARERLGSFLQASKAKFTPRHVVLGGFSQGAMLACDWLLHDADTISALLLMSASRINFAAWEISRARLHDLPVLITHGTRDADLAFSAGEKLRDFALAAHARVTWVPFEGGHEIPLPVWRAVRRILRTLA